MSSPAQTPSEIQPVHVRSLAPLWEIAVAYGLIEGALWSLGNARYWWSVAAMVWIVGITIARRRSLRELGMADRGLRESLWIAGVALVFAGLCLSVGSVVGSLHDYSSNGALAARSIAYLIWSFEQEFILQSFIFLRLESLVGSSRAVGLAAILFAVAHMPSPVLACGSMVMALVFCEAFRRYGNIYPLAIAHWIIGLSLSLALPDFISRHMRVGIGYLRFVAR